MHSWVWGVLGAYTALLWVVAPRATSHRGFLWARSPDGTPPSTTLLTASVVVSWIFAKSITNAANLGERAGLVGGLSYAAWYLSIPIAGLLIFRIRRAGHEGLIPFLTDRFGPASAVLFSLAILVRLFNEVWSNTAVVASYFAPATSGLHIAAALAFTGGVLLYTLKGGLRASIFTDRLQVVLAAVLLVTVLAWVLPRDGGARLLTTGRWTLSGGLDLLLVALLQTTSYPFHDPVLTDRAFVIEPRRMLKAYVVAGVLGGAAIVLYSLLGVHVKLAGLAGPGDAPVRLVQALGAGAVAVVSLLMMNSAGACLDSAFSAISRHVSVDLAGEGGLHPSGFRGLLAPLRGWGRRDGGLRLARWSMVTFALLGNLPLLWRADILKATTISGTMVLGLAPAFLLWRWHRRAPSAFVLSFLTGLTVGILAVAGLWPSTWKLGNGSSGALLAQNAFGLLACFAVYGLGLALETARAPSAHRTAAFFAAGFTESRP